MTKIGELVTVANINQIFLFFQFFTYLFYQFLNLASVKGLIKSYPQTLLKYFQNKASRYLHQTSRSDVIVFTFLVGYETFQMMHRIKGCLKRLHFQPCF